MTNVLWDTVWPPANVLRYCTPAQWERYLLPAIWGERRDRYAVREPGAGSDPTPLAATVERAAAGWRVRGRRLSRKASEPAGRVVDRAVQIFGGHGYLREYAVERSYRDLRLDHLGRDGGNSAPGCRQSPAKARLCRPRHAPGAVAGRDLFTNNRDETRDVTASRRNVNSKGG